MMMIERNIIFLGGLAYSCYCDCGGKLHICVEGTLSKALCLLGSS